MVLNYKLSMLFHMAGLYVGWLSTYQHQKHVTAGSCRDLSNEEQRCLSIASKRLHLF